MLINNLRYLFILLILEASAVSAASPGNGSQINEESFFISMPADGIAVTGGEQAPLLRLPVGIDGFKDYSLRHGLVVVTRLRNDRGEVIGFASELEVFPENARAEFATRDIIWKTAWNLVIPGRGMIFLFQQEHSGELASRTMGEVARSGQDWVGEASMVTTVGPAENGRGIIVGGTGEFEGIQGNFIEIDRMTRFTRDGQMDIDVELKLFKTSPGIADN